MRAPNQVCEHTGRLIYGIIHLLAVLKGLPGKLFQFLLHAFMILHNRIQSPWGTSNMIINCIINQHLKTAIIIKFVVIVVIVDVEIVYPVKSPGRLHNYCNISKQPKMVCQVSCSSLYCTSSRNYIIVLPTPRKTSSITKPTTMNQLSPDAHSDVYYQTIMRLLSVSTISALYMDQGRSSISRPAVYRLHQPSNNSCYF